MHKATGFVSILVGLGIAAYALAGVGVAPDESQSGAAAVAETVIVQAPPYTDLAPGAQPASSTMSPDMRPPADAQTRKHAPASSEISVREPLPSVSRQEPVRTVGAARNGVRTPVGQSTSANGATPLDRMALTRALQRELQRVGCYSGSVSGVWNPSTRHAMKAFTERVNASLPVDEPDDILLAMLQSHQEKACAPSCLPGQNCVRNAIVARNASAHLQPGQVPPMQAMPGENKSPAVDNSTAATTGEPAPGLDVSMPGRMALAGPKHETEIGRPTTDPGVARRNAERSKQAARTKAREAELPRNKRRMGVWLFQDAPVDRVLSR